MIDNNSYKYKYIYTVNKPLSLDYPPGRRGVIDSVIISMGV